MMKPKQSDSWFVRKLIALGACDEAIKYARKYRTFPAAWNECLSTRWVRWLVEFLFFPPHNSIAGCAGCAWHRTSQGKAWDKIDTASEVRRRFPADRVAEKLRQVK